MNSYNGFSPNQRMKALGWFKKQMALGNKPKSPKKCECCGQTEGLLMWHSEDYSEPFDLDHIGKHGLCYKCHMMIHCRFKSPEAFLNYAKHLSNGLVFQATEKSNWPAFREAHLVRRSTGALVRKGEAQTGHLIEKFYNELVLKRKNDHSSDDNSYQ